MRGFGEEGRTMKSILSAVIGAALALSAIEADAQATPGERQVSLTIETDTLASALDKWAQQSGFQIFVQDWEATKKLPARSLNGTFTAQDALEQLLSGTSLTYTWISDKAVSIRKKTQQTVPTALQRTSLEGQQGIPVAKFSGDDVGSGAVSHAAAVTGSGNEYQQQVEEVEEVIVTGSHIRGGDAISPVFSVSAVEIAETGFSSIQDWVDTLPQNFSSIPNEESGGGGNFNRGTTVNLRGLGAGTTLVLVNGRRQPAAGTEGDFVDISSLPTSAVDRVEVLTDGASAVYGSDAIGGVVNVVLRKDFSGLETGLRYAAADGIDEQVASQLIGTNWDGGHLLFAYQYYHRTALDFKDRPFAASSDKRPMGGDDFRSSNSNPGNIFDPLTGAPAFAIPAGQDGRNLAPEDLLPGVVNLQSPQANAELLPERDMHSAFLTVSHQLSDSLDLFLESRYSERRYSQRLPTTDFPWVVPASNAFFVDPFGGSPFLIVGYDFSEDVGTNSSGITRTATGTIGATKDWRTWKSTLSASWGEERLDYQAASLDFAALDAALADSDPATAFNPFGDGSNTNPATLDQISVLQLEKSRSETKTVGIVADGPLFALPHGGEAKLAIGVDHRQEDFRRGTEDVLSTGRDITATYAELVLPFISNDGPGGLRALSLSAAGRYERYSDFGSTFNPKIGLRVVPWDALEMHATWGTSFRAPRLLDLDDRSRSTGNVVFPTPIPDPTNPLGFSSSLLRFGGNSSLKEETADTWTAGMTLRLADRSSISLNYFDITYDDRIVQPGPLNTFGVLGQEDVWADIIHRNPTQAEVESACNDPNFLGDPAACVAAPPDVIVDFRKLNISKTEVNGIDIAFDHRLVTTFGEIGVSLGGTYTLHHKSAVTDDSSFVEFLDTTGNPVSERFRLTTSWSHLGYDVSLSVNYTGSYDDTTQVPKRTVDAWTTIDSRISYRTPASAGWLSDVDVALTVSNLLDEDPPFVNSAIGYDAFNASALGRFIGLQVTKAWGGG
jgi:iron complex outermembrane recepter protein